MTSVKAYAPNWVVAVDLGQSIDPTAIAVLEVTTHASARSSYWYPISEERPQDLVVPELSWFDSTPNGSGELKTPHRVARIDVRHLERLPLRMSYVDQIAHIAATLRRPPLDELKPRLVVDQTGVGRPVVDMLRRARLNPVPVTITAGDGESQTAEGEYRVSKLRLVSRLQAALHAGELRIAKDLPEARTLVSELQDFRGIFAETGYARFGAREGAHDDLVLAVAIGAWWASVNRQSKVFTYHC